ncbi:MAG: sodium:proton antiporter, partial [Dehalococcoidia bacterium]|nr:sodium:proton antiporter [Dehalococcoidia bacterium]
MRTVLVYSILLFLGLGLSQGLPAVLGDFPDVLTNGIRVLTLTGLAFIMIRVGFEFHIEKSNL